MYTMKNEIILYRPNETAEQIEVRIENDTVWLSQAQMAMLLDRQNRTSSCILKIVLKKVN